METKEQIVEDYDFIQRVTDNHYEREFDKFSAIENNTGSKREVRKYCNKFKQTVIKYIKKSCANLKNYGYLLVDFNREEKKRAKGKMEPMR